MSTPTFYIFHGDDDLRIDEEVGAMLAKMREQPNGDLNTALFDCGGQRARTARRGAGVSVPRGQAAGDCARPADVDHAQGSGRNRQVGGRGAAECAAAATGVGAPGVCRARQTIRLATKSSSWRRATPTATKKPSSCQRTAPWIIKRAKEVYDTSIEPAAATALASVTVGDLRRADNELFKLVSYVGGERAITVEDVALLTPYVADASMFEMVDALAEGRGKVALSLVHRLLEQDEDVFGLYGMITRQFRLLLLAKEHLTSGGSPKEIASGDQCASVCRREAGEANAELHAGAARDDLPRAARLRLQDEDRADRSRTSRSTC